MTRTHTRRKRELARLKAERAAERSAARRRRRRNLVAGGTSILVVVIAGTVAAIALTGGSGSSKTAPAASATPAAAAKATTKGTTTKVGTCVYAADGTVPSKPVSLPRSAPTVSRTQVTAVIDTNYGTMTATLDGDKAPCTVHALETLAAAKFYDSSPCHRQTAENIYVLQCGDPTGKGTGGPGFTYGNENTKGVTYNRGVIAMANTGAANSDGSQFFISYKDPNAEGVKLLTGNYTVVGTITKGLDVLDKITAKGIQGGGTDGAPASKPVIRTLTITQP